MTNLDAQTALFTRIQTLLLAAKNERNEGKLRQGADLLNSAEFGTLPPKSQEDLASLYSEALFSATGALSL